MIKIFYKYIILIAVFLILFFTALKIEIPTIPQFIADKIGTRQEKIISSRRIVLSSVDSLKYPFSTSTHEFLMDDEIAKYFSCSYGSVGSKTCGGNIFDLSFSPDGTRTAFILRISKSQSQEKASLYKEGDYLVADSKMFLLKEDWNWLNIEFSKDSSELLLLIYNLDAYYGNQDKKSHQLGSFIISKNRNSDNIVIGSPLKEGEDKYFLNGQQYGEDYFRGSIFQSSKDSKIIKTTDEKHNAYVETIGSCGGEISFCHRRVIVKEDSKLIFKSRKYDGEMGSIDNLKFFNKNDLAYLVSEGSNWEKNNGHTHFIAINDKPGVTFDDFGNGSMQISVDGKYLAYGAMKDKKIWWIVEEILPDLNNKTVEYLDDIK